MPYNSHLRSASDLVTPYEQIRAGFLTIALEKNRYATPYVKEARALKAIASKAAIPHDLMDMTQIRSALLTASGISDKALGHLGESGQNEAIANLIEKFLEPAGKSFIDELVFRFLLTRGDSLGGKMRNLAGRIAEQRVVGAIVATLSIQGKDFGWYDSNARKWLPGKKDDPGIESSAKGLHWANEKRDRTLVMNLNVPDVDKNVDFCLFDSAPNDIKRGKNKQSVHHSLERYVALGELKGGIDPAGADEHWKTANTALGRIRTLFSRSGYTPHLFFVGAAIAKSMADEIFNQLQAGDIANAANLTNDDQLFSLVNWLVTL